MSNQAEIDYEKQFQEDLAKATALSLEQQALDEYNRTKKYGAAFTQNAQQEATNKYYAQIRRQHYAREANSSDNHSSGRSQNTAASSSSTLQHSLALPKLQSQRRHSEITHISASSSSALLTEVERSKTPPASRPENDLINFASPTSKNNESTSFEKLIEDLQKLQATNPQTALVPLGPTAAAPMYSSPSAYHPAVPMYAGSAAAVKPPNQYGVATATGAVGMQLVPFVPTQQQQKVPLTNEELNKLYSMTPAPQPPHTAPVYAARPPLGYIPTMNTTGYYPANPQIMQGSSAYTAPVHYPNAYGFQFQAPGIAAQQHPYYPTNMSAALNSSSSGIQSSASSLAGSALNVHQPMNQSSNAASDKSFNQQTHSVSSFASTASFGGSPSQSNGFQNKRQVSVSRKPSKVPGLDLIDLSHEDDSRVSVLEAFDPLLHDSDDVTKKLNNN